MAVFISVTLERQIEEILTAFETSVLRLPEVMGGYLMSGGADGARPWLARSPHDGVPTVTQCTKPLRGIGVGGEVARLR